MNAISSILMTPLDLTPPQAPGGWWLAWVYPEILQPGLRPSNGIEFNTVLTW